MSIKRIIIAHIYHPGSAATNRILAYAKGFAEVGKEVNLVLGCEKREDLPEDRQSGVVTIVDSNHNVLIRKMAKSIKELYVPGECAILVYGTPVLCRYLPKNRYDIFYECTEIPFYGKKRTIKSYIREAVKMLLARRATGMLVISQALKDYFITRGIERVEVINMFVDNSRFQNRSLENKDKYIAYCGWVSEYKDGVDCLIKAFSGFNKVYTDYKLYIIGDFISLHDKQRLEQLVNSLELGSAVVFTGKVTPEKMPEFLCSAQILALARPNNEQSRYGFPTKLGEYLATGNPVVVTDVGEISVFLHNKQNCVIVPPNNPYEFCEALKWVVTHPKEASNIAFEVRRTVEKEFSYVTQSKKAISFIEKCIGHP